MNAGMYGMASGVGGQLPRLTGIAGKNQTFASLGQNISTAALNAGARLITAPTPVSGVRQNILTINGKGFLKYLGIAESGGSSTAMRAEVLIDGIKIIDATWTHGGSGNFGPFLIGNFSPLGAFEYLPFSSSVEVFVTETGVIGGLNYVFLADLHQ